MQQARGGVSPRLGQRAELPARVSTYGQTLDAQLEQLRAGGCAKVYREKASGAQADRRELLRILKRHRARRRGDGDAD